LDSILKKKHIDRINRIERIFNFYQFPEETDKTQSPAAKNRLIAARRQCSTFRRQTDLAGLLSPGKQAAQKNPINPVNPVYK
jgi:hypothetical protein